VLAHERYRRYFVRSLDIPAHLLDSHYPGSEKLGHGIGYKYPHSFKDHYVAQQYLPDKLADRKYYVYGENKIESATKTYWEQIKKNEKK